MLLDKISHISRNIEPKIVISNTDFFKLSPKNKVAILGIINPKKGIGPTNTNVIADISATTITPNEV